MAQSLHNIFKSELYKIRHGKLIWGLSISLIIVALWKLVNPVIMPMGISMSSLSGLSTGYVDNCLGLLDFLVIAALVCFTLGTDHLTGNIRQITSKGYSRPVILLGKILAYTCVSVIMVVGYRLVTFFEFSIFFGVSKPNQGITPTRIIFFTISLFFFSFMAVTLTVLITMLIKNTGSAFCASLALIVAMDVFTALTSFFLNQYIHCKMLAEIIVNYWFMNMARDMGSKGTDSVVQVSYLVAFVVLGVLLYAIASLIYSKQDVA